MKREEEIRQRIEEKASEDFSRSGGPGGQHVNKTNSKVTLRIPLSILPIGEEERRRLSHVLSERINAEQELVIRSSETRSQRSNRRRAYERAAALIVAAIHAPSRRRPSSPSRAAKERRLQEKRRRGERKKFRRPPKAGTGEDI
jgi:ribosome-associated protein